MVSQHVGDQEDVTSPRDNAANNLEEEKHQDKNRVEESILSIAQELNDNELISISDFKGFNREHVRSVLPANNKPLKATEDFRSSISPLVGVEPSKSV